MGSVGSNKGMISKALDYYTEDGYYINSVLRNDGELDDKEKQYVKLLDIATNETVKHDTLYRIVDMSVVFKGLSDIDADHLRAHLLIGDDYYDKGAYMQGIKSKMTDMVNKLNSGDIVLHDKGFMSTTYDFNEAQNKENDSTHSSYFGIILKINNANKLKGAEIGGSEKEVLLKRNYNYNFKKIYVKDGKIIVDTDVK